MKSRRGFTLIELVVSMAIMALVMGALVNLFGTSVSHQLTGFNQQEMYTQARRLENDLKNTLRYAVDNRGQAISIKFSDGIKGEIIDTDRSMATKLEYTALIYNNAKKCNQKQKITLQWSDDSRKQLKLTKAISDEKLDANGNSSYAASGTVEYLFPEHKENSVFNTQADNYGAFPVTVVTENGGAASEDIHEGMLKITLPFRYKTGGSYKTNILETKVAFNQTFANSGGTAGIIGLNDTSWWTYNDLRSLSSNSVLAGPKADAWNMVALALKLEQTGFAGILLIASDIYQQLQAQYNYITATEAQQLYIKEHVQKTIEGKDLDAYIQANDVSQVSNWRLSGADPYMQPPIKTFTPVSGVYTGNGLNLSNQTITLNGETIGYHVVNSARLQNVTVKGKGTIILYEVNQGINIDNVRTDNEVNFILMSDSNRISIRNSVLNNTVINARDASLYLGDATIGGIIYSKVNIDFSGNITLNGFPDNVTSALEAGKAYFN